MIAILFLSLLALNQLNTNARYQLYWLATGALTLIAISGIGVWCASINEEPFSMSSSTGITGADLNGGEKNDWIAIVVLMLVISVVLVALLPKTISYDLIYYMLVIWIFVLEIWFLLIYKSVRVASINKWIDILKKKKMFLFRNIGRSMENTAYREIAFYAPVL